MKEPNSRRGFSLVRKGEGSTGNLIPPTPFFLKEKGERPPLAQRERGARGGEVQAASLEGNWWSSKVAFVMPQDQAREQLKNALDMARSGNYAGARHELEELLHGVPDFADGHYYLGLACQRLGDNAAAQAAFERCLEIDPFYHDAREQLRSITPPQDMLQGDESGPIPSSEIPPPPAPSPPEPVPTPSPPVLPVIPPPLESPQQEKWIPVLVKPGGFWIRGMALLIDSILIHFAITPFLPLLMLPFQSILDEFMDMGQEKLAKELVEQFMQGNTTPLLMWSLFNLLILTAEITFNTIVFGYFHYVSGQTPGKRLLGVRVVDNASLDYLTIGQSIWRYAASTVSLCICGIGYLMAAFNPEKRALHDYMASTRVVYSERVPMEIGEKAATAALVLLAVFGGIFYLL